ncbi:MAG TPA: glycerophosphodiester phosphodiesterase [Myxococcales bacterium]|jgi:glycerophosphoryl diester phosphodiesterase
MVRLYAHRGAAAELPENTLPAFARALELGADAIETDAHLTADGQVVLSHDATGKRMAGVARAISECTLEEIWRWDAGKNHRPRSSAPPASAHGPFRVPSLAEALVEFPQTPFNVDVKDPSPRMIAAILDVVRRAGAEERVLLASFETQTLQAIRGAGYRGPTGLAQGEVAKLALLPGPFARRLKLEGQRAQVPVSAYGLRLDKRGFLERCHRRGLAVDFWTIDDPAQAKRLVELGADGIMTDDPALVAPALGKKRG